MSDVFESSSMCISNKAKFEFLPNEIILDLFEYFSFNHLFRGFFNLNLRFNRLLCQQFQKFHLDFRFISKTDFHEICQSHISSVINQIISLHLSNDVNTPQQIELFLSQPIQLRQFTRLQSLSLSHVRSLQTLNRIMDECSYLLCLTHLTFTDCELFIIEKSAEHFFNTIWSLSKLKYCYLDIHFCGDNYFPHPTVVSTSLKHLFIQHTTCSSVTFLHLCQYTPCLRSLSINFIDGSSEIASSLSPLSSITRLDVLFNSSKIYLQNLLINMPNLYHLTLDTFHIYMDGYEWEDMITKHLTKLKIFEFKMKYTPIDKNGQEILWDHVLDSFQTKFWIEEHRWFVRCHGFTSNDQSQLNRIELFSLPYRFKQFPSTNKFTLATSTRLNDDKYLSCDDVFNLYYGPSSFTSSIMSFIRFTNIQSLTLSLPFNNQFLSVVSNLNRLKVLCISLDKNGILNIIQSQLKLILDQAVNLRSLSFNGTLQMSYKALPLQITSASIRQINLREEILRDDWFCIDEELCVQLSRSSLGKQCKTLLINVKNRRNIIYLVNNMPNLQALNVQCEDDDWTVNSKDDKLVKWLHEHLPSTCSFTRDADHIRDIKLWIS